MEHMEHMERMEHMEHLYILFLNTLFIGHKTPKTLINQGVEHMEHIGNTWNTLLYIFAFAHETSLFSGSGTHREHIGAVQVFRFMRSIKRSAARRRRFKGFGMLPNKRMAILRGLRQRLLQTSLLCGLCFLQFQVLPQWIRLFSFLQLGHFGPVANSYTDMGPWRIACRFCFSCEGQLHQFGQNGLIGSPRAHARRVSIGLWTSTEFCEVAIHAHAKGNNSANCGNEKYGWSSTTRTHKGKRKEVEPQNGGQPKHYTHAQRETVYLQNKNGLESNVQTAQA